MDISFFQFLKTGEFEVINSSFKAKIKYLTKIYIYIFIFVCVCSAIKEVISWSTKTDIHYTSLMIREMVINFFLQGMISPVYCGITFWICLTNFDSKKIKISISAIIASVFCLVFHKYQYIPILKHEYINLIFIFLFIFLLSYFCLNKFISSSMTELASIFWKNKFLIMVYLFAFLFSLIMYLWNDGNFQAKIMNTFGCFLLALILIFIRSSYGLKYAVLFHYALLLPGLIVSMLFYANLY
jgi:hypothetical protein